jgi:probable HAF family extracellular repeat protein
MKHVYRFLILQLNPLGGRWLIVVLALGLLSLLPVGPAGAASFQGLGELPGGSFSSEALGVSGDGRVVVGMSISALGQEAFIWTEDSGMVAMGDLGGEAFQSFAFDASADGSVVVGHATSDQAGPQIGDFEAFRWTQATGMEGIGDLEGEEFYSLGLDVSADGSVVVGGSDSTLGFQAYRWTQATGIEGLGDLEGGGFRSVAFGISADGLVVVGESNSTPGNQAFRWEDDEDPNTDDMVGLGDLPDGGFNSSARAVSADGSVVVGRGRTALGDEAFRWTQDGGMVGLGDLPGGAFDSFALDVSADGSVVVGRGHSASGQEAFIWDAANGMRSLKEVLINDLHLFAQVKDWTLTSARGISDDGLTVVGFGISPSGSREAWMARLDPIAPVTIDMTPGNPPDSITINLCSVGLVPVAIFGSAELDVNDIVVQTIQVAGSGVAVRGVSRLLYTIRDLNGDGHPDMLVHIEVENFDLAEGDTGAVLTSDLTDGTTIQGSDLVTIIRGEDCPNP